jgi:aryl-alcohol dehydrogenase-like predicted oxidoreductase
MLQEKRISAIIPGVTEADQLNENVKASYERGKPLDANDRQALRQCEENFHASLPDHYRWLHHWKTV